MARKRANSTKSKNEAQVTKKAATSPLAKIESQYFQELVDCSNRLAALQQQRSQFIFIIGKLNENRKKIQDKVVKPPFSLPLIPNVMNYLESDTKVVFKLFDEQITNYKNSLKSLKGQIQHRQEEYEESAVRTRDFLTKRYEHLTAKHIVPARKAVADEENLFEAEFKKLLDDPETMKEFKKAKQEAVKVNTKRETKKKGKK